MVREWTLVLWLNSFASLLSLSLKCTYYDALNSWLKNNQYGTETLVRREKCFEELFGPLAFLPTDDVLFCPSPQKALKFFFLTSGGS